MEFRQKYILNFKTCILFGLLMLAGIAKSQVLIRQSLGTAGGSFSSGGLTVQSSVGQSSSTNTSVQAGGTMRQGFIQPPVKNVLQITPLPSVLIYPNPSTGLFKIKMDFEPGDYFTVYNMLGSKIEERKITASEPIQSFDLTGNSEGIYSITIFRQNLIIKTTKIILLK